MWEPQPLTTPRASKACRGKNFTFTFTFYYYPIIQRYIAWVTESLFSSSFRFLLLLLLGGYTSVKSFVSLQFLNLRHSIGLLGREIGPS
jgi:hypothetical protein